MQNSDSASQFHLKSALKDFTLKASPAPSKRFQYLLKKFNKNVFNDNIKYSVVHYEMNNII